MPYSLRRYNTFNLNPTCKELLETDSTDKLKELFDSGRLLKEELLVIGSGSNILFTRDWDGTVIHISDRNISVKDQRQGYVIVEAGAGVIWDDLVEWAVKHGYGGIENLSLIPGTAGAAPVQNIGAYGSELKDTLSEVEVFDTVTGDAQIFSNEQCEFKYRNSIFKKNPDRYIVTKIRIRLTTDNHKFNLQYGNIGQRMGQAGKVTLKKLRNTIITIRSEKLPDPSNTGNAGSFFKNPVVTEQKFREIARNHEKVPSYPDHDNLVKIPAAWLIEQCGWKGYRSGDTGVYDMQPLVLVNYGNATGSEIFKLSERIIASVKEKFGISLEREVIII